MKNIPQNVKPSLMYIMVQIWSAHLMSFNSKYQWSQAMTIPKYLGYLEVVYLCWRTVITSKQTSSKKDYGTIILNKNNPFIYLTPCTSQQQQKGRDYNTNSSTHFNYPITQTNTNKGHLQSFALMNRSRCNGTIAYLQLPGSSVTHIQGADSTSHNFN